MANQIELQQHVERVVLPKKGRLSAVARAHESAPEFISLRHQHSAVESAINAPTMALTASSVTSLAVVARNIQRLGAVLREQEAQRRRGPYKKAA